MTWLEYDESLAAAIASAMDLRKPNAEALAVLAAQVSRGDGREVIADLATGVGKTYLAAALIDYLAQKGVRNILLVTPGSTILTKSILNFTPGSTKHVPGAEVTPLLVTADNFERGEIGDALHDDRRLKLFVFNVQQLIAPGAKVSRRTREANEHIGGALYEHLRQADDLVVIADEHHVYREKAARFNAAIQELGARAVVGLTATPDVADVDAGKVVYRYSLARAIADELVKIPVIVYRADGRKDLRTQLADACLLRARKEPVWTAYAAAAGTKPIAPIVFVVAQSIEDARVVAQELSSESMLPGAGQVLLITSESSDQALQLLGQVEEADSPVRAIVSVDKLKEGWDVKNIGVIVAYRALASKSLTEQVLGRGLRLPFGRRTGLPGIDQVDLVAHESYQQLLRDKNALLERLIAPDVPISQESMKAAEQLDFTPLHGDTVDSPATGFAVTTGETLDGVSDAELLLAHEMGSALQQAEVDIATVGTPMPVNPFPPITFPSQEKVVEPNRFSLDSVELLPVEQQGRLFAHDPEVLLVRRELNAVHGVDGSVMVVSRSVESASATRVVVAASTVRRSLVASVLDSGMVEPELVELTRAGAIVDAFLLGAGVTDDAAWEWSADHVARAGEKLTAVISAARKATQFTTAFRWSPTKLPPARQQPGATRAVWDEYRKGEWFGPWDRSIEKFARFDSETAELLLARKIDTWEQVKYWQRLYVHDGAFIPWTGGRYYPDFVVVDNKGLHWVLEAKSNKAAEDSAEVALKAQAAEDWIARVNASKQFGTWHYRVVTEARIAAAADWGSLTVR